MGVIRILPPEVVNRIAAGEVVERPASVLKELVENSVDSGATEIDVTLEDGGKRLIGVRDNGCGMEPEDLPLAFASHATSKLRVEHLESNLMGVASLGFRGEALASVGAVAMVSVTSRTARGEHAWLYRPEDGRRGDSRPGAARDGGGDSGEGNPVPAAGEPGTIVEVRNLFYNVPARRKFLRATATELSHCLQQLTRLALAHPGIRFGLAHGGKSLLRLAPVDSLRERLEQILGRDPVAGLIEVRRDAPVAGAPALHGFVGDPRLHRKDARDQHLFVNGRWVRDRLLSHALRTAYQGFLIPGIQPVAYLLLEVAPQDVDVNVHPTKVEVRFRDSSELYQLLHGAVRHALEGRSAHEGRSAQGGWAAQDGGPAQDGGFAQDGGPAQAGGPGGVREQLAGPPGDLSHASPSASGGVGGRLDFSPGTGRIEAAVRDFLSRPSLPQGAPGRPPFRGAAPRAPQGGGSQPPSAEPSIVVDVAAGPRTFQVLRSYIVLDAPEGIVLIDQHAFHEKILFEEIHARLESGKLPSQRLIIPEVIDVAPELIALVERATAILEPLGFDIAPFGPGSIGVHAFPALFDGESGATDLPEIVRGVLASLLDDVVRGEISAGETPAGETPAGETPAGETPAGETPAGERCVGEEVATSAPPAFREALRRLAATMACKRAVKAGTPLGPEEIRMLLERGTLAEDPRNCPHGRPTAAFLGRREIERLFDRK